MEIRVISSFREKMDYKTIRNVGDIIECTDERGKYLIERGFAEQVRVEPHKVEAEPSSEIEREGKKRGRKPFNLVSE